MESYYYNHTVSEKEQGVQDLAVHIHGDRRSIQTSSSTRRNSLRSELLETKPNDLDQLFERSTAVEYDICFPSQPSSTAVTSRDMDLGALAQYAHHAVEQDFNKSCLPQPSDFDLQKKLSRYGDNHTPSLPIHQRLERFIYYHPDTGYRRGRCLMDLQTDNCTLEDLFTKTNYWIDITSPSTSEMKLICKIFRIHPLTVEDIMSQEIREKCDVFRNYLFICYRAFVHDDDVLKPISFYNIVSKRSIVSIHYGQVPHVDHVQRRVDQLQGYIMVIPDWINYAIMDEITDSFAPIILQIESEVDAIDDLVLLLTSTDQSDMVSRIGSCRKRVMQMLRLLGTKADVVRTLIKRYEERSRDEAATVHHVVTGPTTCCQQACAHSVNSKTPTTILGHKKKSSSIIPDFIEDDGRILPDVGLYLGDVQDHILMMLQNLNHYETVLARSHSNYLARISIELTQTSNSTNHVIGRLTIFATVLLPMNLVTGLWGMNVKVPGKDVDNLIYFFWIVCSLAVFAILSLTVARRLQFF